MAIQTRRHKPRVRLNETAYLNFLSGIRGVVVDVSEGGLRFKTSSPLKSGESSKFRFTFSGGGEVVADLAWTDEARTTGGLSFESLSSEVRQQTRTWTEQSWETSRKSRGLAEPTAAVALGGPKVKPSNPVVFTEIQSLAQTKRKAAASTLDGIVRTNPGSMENDLSMFQLEATPPISVSAHQSPGRRRLAMVALVVLFFLGAATAAAGYFDPSGTRDVMARAQEVAERFAIRIHNLPMPKSNQQRFGGAVAPGAE